MSTETQTQNETATEETITKKDRILNFLNENPNAKTADVVSALEADGVEVSANYISMVKSQNGGGRPQKISVANAMAQLVKVRDLVEELGGAEAVRNALEVSQKFTELVGAGNETDSLEALDQFS